MKKKLIILIDENKLIILIDEKKLIFWQSNELRRLNLHMWTNVFNFLVKSIISENINREKTIWDYKINKAVSIMN